MFKTILVAVDLAHTKNRKAMIAVAREFVEKHGSELTLLYVVTEVPLNIDVQLPKNYYDSIVSVAVTELTELTKKHKLPPSLNVQVLRGVPYRVILAIAQEINADLIMMASHQPESEDYLLGSVAGKIVRHATCSVFVNRLQVAS